MVLLPPGCHLPSSRLPLSTREVSALTVLTALSAMRYSVEAAGDWLSGRAPRSHRGGHWFDPSIAHPGQRPVPILGTGRSAVHTTLKYSNGASCPATDRSCRPAALRAGRTPPSAERSSVTPIGAVADPGLTRWQPAGHWREEDSLGSTGRNRLTRRLLCGRLEGGGAARTPS